MAFGARERRIADMMIRKYGQRCLLRSNGTDRECRACEVANSIGRGTGRISNLGQRRFLVSAIGLDSEPNNDSEELVLIDQETGADLETLHIAAPAEALAPAGLIIYWRLLIDG